MTLDSVDSRQLVGMDLELSKYVGVPFVDRGRSLDGCDCWGLVRIFYEKEMGLILPDFAISAMNIHKVTKTMNDGISDGTWSKVSMDDLIVGDVVAMALSMACLGSVNHVGIYVGKGKFLHTIQNQHSAICSIDAILWKQRIKGFYRWAN